MVVRKGFTIRNIGLDSSGWRNHFPGLTGGENSPQWTCAKAGSCKTILPIQGTVQFGLHVGVLRGVR